MGFKAIVCESCGDTAHPNYTYRRMIGRVGTIMIHDDCCNRVYLELCKIGDGPNPIADRFRMHGPHWPSLNGTSKDNSNVAEQDE